MRGKVVSGVVLLLALAGPARPASFSVTKTADTADGVCDSDDCSLREAILAANDSNDPQDVVDLPAGTYLLTIANTGPNEDLGVRGDLDILPGGLTISGAGIESTSIQSAVPVIDANDPNDPSDRVFDVFGSATVLISDVAIRNGSSVLNDGGGIRNQGNLTLKKCLLTGNKTLGPGNDTQRRGGAIFNAAGGKLTLDGTQLASNTSAGRGGGLYNDSTVPDAVTIFGSAINSNMALGDDGGGVYNAQGKIEITTSTIQDNLAIDSGGGLRNENGILLLTASTVSGNQASTQGGGIRNRANGTIVSSTFKQNTLEGAGIHLGAGLSIENDGTEATTLRNCTFSGNVADGNDASPASGGGIFVDSTGAAQTILANCTIAANMAQAAPGVASGGGVFVDPNNPGTSIVTVRNTIISGNSASTGGPDCNGSLASAGYNLIQDPSGCTLGGILTGNILGSDPQLGPLANSGGLTETHALPPGSIATDAGNPTTPGFGGNTCEATDQRGLPRPSDGDSDFTVFCDMGAFELQAGTPTPTTTQTRTPTHTPTRTRTPTLTHTPTRTSTSTRTLTPTRTRTATRTLTPLPSRTPTRTPRTPVPSPTKTSTPLPPRAIHLSVSLVPVSVQADAAVDLLLEAVDVNGALVPSYSGTVIFDSSDFSAVRPGATLVTGGRKSLPGSVRFRNAGTHTVFAYDQDQPQLRGRSNEVEVAEPASGHFYVRSGCLQPPAGGCGDDTGGNGSFDRPWKTIQASVNRVAAGSTLHVLRGAYPERVRLEKSIKLLGESINECIVSGTGQGSTIRIQPRAAAAVEVRRLTVQGSGSGPFDAGIDLYGAETASLVVVTNNIVQKNRHGIRVNETGTDRLRTRINNNTLIENSGHALYVRRAVATVSSDIFLETGQCAGYGYLARSVLIEIDSSLLFEFADGLCATPLTPLLPTNKVDAPQFFDVDHYYVDKSSPAFDSGPDGLEDVDGSQNDRGAYGGPQGELHLPPISIDARLSLLAAAGLILTALLLRRRRGTRA